MPYRHVATDRAGLNAEAVAAAVARRAGTSPCACCGLPLDPVLTRAGFETHPCCSPDEVSAAWPPLTWDKRLVLA